MINVDLTPVSPLPPITPDKGRMTEAEVRVAGHVSQMLCSLRTMLARPSGGCVQTNEGTVKLGTVEIEAILALLIERNENFLTDLDITIDRPITALTATS